MAVKHTLICPADDATNMRRRGSSKHAAETTPLSNRLVLVFNRAPVRALQNLITYGDSETNWSCSGRNCIQSRLGIAGHPMHHRIQLQIQSDVFQRSPHLFHRPIGEASRSSGLQYRCSSSCCQCTWMTHLPAPAAWDAPVAQPCMFAYRTTARCRRCRRARPRANRESR